MNLMHWIQVFTVSFICFNISSGVRLKHQSNRNLRHTIKEQRGETNTEKHGKYFQDIYSVQLAPHLLEFGHVCESPHDWEQRFERKDLAKNKHQGKVRWGDHNGGYGEHYWDFNHADTTEHADSSTNVQHDNQENAFPKQENTHNENAETLRLFQSDG